MPILDHFGIIAPLYEKVIRPHLPDQMVRLAGLPVNGRVLDAGGGTGRIAQCLLEQAEQVVVADLSLGMLKQARRKHGLVTVNSHTEKLPFADDSFDAVIMVDALHHVCNQGETAAELWRVVRPGGRIVIEEPDIRTLAVKAIAVAEKLALMRSHFLSPSQIAALFPFAGARTQIEIEKWNAWVMVEKIS